MEGKLRTSSWEDNGQKRTSVEIVADTFTMLGGARKGGEEPQKSDEGKTVPPPPISDEPKEEDDLPF